MIAETDHDLSLLKEFETTYVRAESGKRFANLIIDTISFNIISWLIGEISLRMLPGLIRFLDNVDPFSFWEIVYNTLLFSFFIGAQEIVFNGKSLGKFITQTRALHIDGTTLSSRSAFLRGLSRAIPFEVFSALGSPPNPWHDKWTDTMVIDEQKTAEHTANI